METTSNGPANCSAYEKRKLIVTATKTSFENVTDFVARNTRREQQDDGFYVMNMETTINLYKQWHENLPRIRPFYAIKCNPDPVLVRQLHMLGTGFDCASIQEIELALKVGSETSDIIYAHPCKKPSHLSFAAERGVSMMTFDSKDELIKIKKLHPDSELLIRFSPIVKGAVFDCNNFKYGAAVEDCEDILTAAKEMELKIIGASFHVGRCCFNELCFVSTIQSARYIFNIAEKLGFSFDILDVGGGFPGFRKDSEKALFFKICAVINRSLDEHFPATSGITIIAEPGTYFADSPFKLVTNIIAVKEVTRKQVKRVTNPPLKFNEKDHKGYMYYIDDGLYGSFADIPDFEFKVAPIKKTSAITYPSCVCGHFLAGHDIVNRECRLPKLSVGDWLYYDNFGAYTSTVISNFNGFGIVKYTYYFVSLNTWKKMKWTSKDFSADVIFLNDYQNGYPL